MGAPVADNFARMPPAAQREDAEGMTPGTSVPDPLFQRNFGRLGLGCIDSYDNESRLESYSRSRLYRQLR